MSMFCLFEP